MASVLTCSPTRTTKKTIAESSNFAAREHLFVVADICLQCTVEEFVAKKLIGGFFGWRR